MSYFDCLRQSMAILSVHPKTLFVGQSVRYESNAMFRTLAGVPMDRRIEIPVIEDFQMGYCIGLAMTGALPVSLYPRWDFLLLAANQLVNHLDKMPEVKVIVRVAVGAKYPRDSGPQQTQDHTAAFRLMLKHVDVIELNSRFDVLKGYERAMNSRRSALVVERADLYNE